MPNENNIALVRRAVKEIVNEGKTEKAKELFAPNYVWHPGDGVSPDMDRDDHMKDYKDLRNAFPDVKLKVDDIFGDGDKVVTRFTMTATHKGPLKKAVGHVIAPSNKKLTWTGTTIHRVVNGKIAEGWINYDRAGIDEQIGWRT
jgi:predicted ester cyclase